MKNYLFPLLAILLSFIPQTSFAQKAPKTPKVKNYFFTCATWNNLSSEEIFYRSGKSYFPVEFINGERSNSYPLNRSHPFELYAKSFDDKGDTTYNLLGKAKIPSDTRHILFIVEKASDSSDPSLKIFGINDDLSSFPRGSYGFLNFTNTPLNINYDSELANVKPGKISIIIPKGAKGGFKPLYIRNKRNDVIYSTRLYRQMNGREIAIILPSLDKRRPIKMRYLTQAISSQP